MDLPINNEELKELMDALNESNHPDAMKRQFRNELHRKFKYTHYNIIFYFWQYFNLIVYKLKKF